jgi:hypothetical protein
VWTLRFSTPSIPSATSSARAAGVDHMPSPTLGRFTPLTSPTTVGVLVRRRSDSSGAGGLRSGRLAAPR